MAEISPIGRDQNRVGVRWRKEQMQTTVALLPTKYMDRLTLKSVANTENDYFLRKGMMVGSLSSDRSTAFRTTG